MGPLAHRSVVDVGSDERRGSQWALSLTGVGRRRTPVGIVVADMRPATTLTLGLLLAAILVAGTISLLQL